MHRNEAAVGLARALNRAAGFEDNPRGRKMAGKGYYELRGKVEELDKALNAPDVGLCVRTMALEKMMERIAADTLWIKWISSALLGVVIAIAFKVFTG